MDGVLRLVIAFWIFAYAILAGPLWLASISLLAVITAAAFRCPLYDIVGFSTCDKGEANDGK